jgi:hypothetical protein
MRNTVRVVSLVKGDGRLGSLEPCQGGEGVNGIHLLFGDTTLLAGFVRLGPPKIMRHHLASGNSTSSSWAPYASSLAFGKGFWALPYWPMVP